MDWPQAFRWLAIALALAGGGASIAAALLGRRSRNAEAGAKKAHVLYLASYALMSLSIFFLALQGLLDGGD